MPDEHSPSVVAVINTSPDIVDMLRVVLERAGFVVVTLLTFQIRDGEADFDTFLRQHNPSVIVYDIAPPYDANWRLFQHLCQTPVMRARPVVLTSTNVSQVIGLIGHDHRIYEVVGKPYDLGQIVAAVRGAVEAGVIESHAD